MAKMESLIGFQGGLTTRKISRNRRPDFSWQLRQAVRLDRVRGLLAVTVAKSMAKLGFTAITSQLSAVHIDGRTGIRTQYGVVSRRVVTTAFVDFMVDQLQAETSTWGDFKFHDSGVGATAAAIGDTDIQTTDGEARVTGTQLEGATANIYKTVGTITYTTTKSIVEHGLFNIVTGGTLMDRSVFASIGVDNTDQIEFTYELTCTAGG